MHRFVQILVSKRVAQVVVGTTLVLGLVLGFFALRVQRSDDLLAFLPRSNADVATFYEINKRFGGLELALVGVETNDPFDAEKLWAFFHDEDNWRGVLRSKGFFWVAADHRIAYEWAQAGGVSNVQPAGMWWAAIPREHWGHPEELRPDKQANWDSRFGDRAQQLVFIGQNMDEAAIRGRLDACLLDDSLAKADSKDWVGMDNPFPELAFEDEEPE